jgi:hypothetical protein
MIADKLYFPHYIPQKCISCSQHQIFGASLVCMMTDLVPGLPSEYIKPEFGVTKCCFSSDATVLAYFFGPIGVLVLCNTVLFVTTAVKIAELATVYKVIKHHRSFSSLDCSNKLHPLMYCDSKIATKQSIARTKAIVITKNILAPRTISSCVADLQKTPFYGIATDASNNKAEKKFPMVIQYFSKTEGIISNLILVDSLKGETSETV